jgi:hypothetical protein
VSTYRQYRTSLMPTTMQRPAGQAFQGALGDVEDSLIDRAKQAVKARFPLLAPPGALTAIGVERQMPQGPGESTATYAARLVRAWDSWQWAGTPYGLLHAFADAGYPNVVLAQPRGGLQFTLDAGGNLVISSNGTWTPTYVGDPFWSRFDVVLVPPLPPAWIAGGVPASDSSEAAFIKSTVRLWKPGHARLMRVIIQTGGKLWGTPGAQTWGAATGNWGGSEVVWIVGSTWGSAQVWGTTAITWGGQESA